MAAISWVTVSCGHGVVEEGRVEGAAGLAFEHAGGGDHLAHGVEDALGSLRGA